MNSRDRLQKISVSLIVGTNLVANVAVRNFADFLLQRLR